MKIAASFTQAICCITHLAEIESGSTVSGHSRQAIQLVIELPLEASTFVDGCGYA